MTLRSVTKVMYIMGGLLLISPLGGFLDDIHPLFKFAVPLMGVLMLVAAWGISVRKPAARWLGIVLAPLIAIITFFLFYPVFAPILINTALSANIIWVLARKWDES